MHVFDEQFGGQYIEEWRITIFPGKIYNTGRHKKLLFSFVLPSLGLCLSTS